MKTRPAKVLIVDDDREIRWALRSLVEQEGMEAFEAEEGESALKIASLKTLDVVLLDIRMPGVDGIEILGRLRKIDGDLPVLMITGFGSIKDAVQTMRAGAYDYLTKPFENELVVRAIRRALKERHLKRRLMILDTRAEEHFSLQEMMGRSQAICKLADEVGLVAPTDFTVLVTGETGTGKELVARAIHASSSCVSGNMIPVNCGAIPEALIESELFGHEKGAFTGADRAVPGKFEAAASGTLFLDEISSLPLPMQSRLLRVLEERRYHPVGGTKEIKADARVIAATNMDLFTADPSIFRPDLFHRLSGYVIHVPPLRSRKEDVIFLSKRFLDMTNHELGKSIRGFTEAGVSMLMAYDWPGNVRELRNVIRKAVLVADDVIDASHLGTMHPNGAGTLEKKPLGMLYTGDLSLKGIVHRSTAAVEREVISQVMKNALWNKAKAARILKIDYKTMLTKLRTYMISREGDCDGRKEGKTHDT